MKQQNAWAIKLPETITHREKNHTIESNGVFSLEIHFEWRLICRQIRWIRMIAINLYVSNFLNNCTRCMRSIEIRAFHAQSAVVELVVFSLFSSYEKCTTMNSERLNERQWRHYIQCVYTNAARSEVFREFSTESAANIRLNMIRWSDLVAVVAVVVCTESHFKYSLFEWCFDSFVLFFPPFFVHLNLFSLGPFEIFEIEKKNSPSHFTE